MATEGANTNNEGGSQGSPNPGGTTAGAAGAGTEQKPEIKPAVQAHAGGTEQKPVAGAKPDAGVEAKTLDDDAEIDKKAPYSITGEKLIKRIDRSVRSAFKQHFGVDDPEVVKAKLKQLESFETKAEEERRSKLATEEKLKEDLAKEKKRGDELEQKATKEREGRVIDQQETRLQKIAGEFIDSEYIDEVALPKFAVFLRKNKTMAEINAMGDDDVKAWFKEFAEKRPKLAKDTGTTQQQAAPPTKVPLTNGANPGAKPPANKSGVVTEKTARPNQPNSMTKKELNDQGYKW